MVIKIPASDAFMIFDEGELKNIKSFINDYKQSLLAVSHFDDLKDEIYASTQKLLNEEENERLLTIKQLTIQVHDMYSKLNYRILGIEIFIIPLPTEPYQQIC